jgi:lysozyme
MKTSADGRSFIEAFEGKFLHTYDDGTGVLTIGYGHTSAAGPPPVYHGQTITDAECDSILAADLAAVERNVTAHITIPIVQCQFDALVSFDFNTGALGHSSIATKINAGNPTAAMSTLLMYDHAGGRQMDGLTRRRQAERLMYVGQVQQALRLAGAHVTTVDRPMPQAPTRPPSIAFPAPPGGPPVTLPTPSPVPSKKSVIASIISILGSIFRRT